MTISEDRAASVESPLSTLPPIKIRDLPRNFILDHLESYHDARPPAPTVERGYSIWQCSETGLEFAWPMLPGNVDFYAWLSSFASYYPEARWEYGEVRRFLEAQDPAGRKFSKVLDVGCGKGNFLRGLDFIPANHKFGLDLNEVSVEACRRQGFPAFCGTMKTALEANFLRTSAFSVVTSFHCLEHVDRPVEFVRSMATVTSPGGRIFLSTPYSPMSFEADWFDILNHPPHHLTRWNLRSYQQLADILGLTMRCFFPPSATIRQALMTFRLVQYGPYRRVGKIRFYGDLLRCFPVLARLYQVQKKRARENGGISADVILVELTVR
jgi:SAM-dependent methyltransferase